MSKYKTAYMIQKEIDLLNEVIDLRIIKGLSYYGEARRHKLLRAQLERVSPHARSSWFQKSMKLASAFLF